MSWVRDTAARQQVTQLRGSGKPYRSTNKRYQLVILPSSVCEEFVNRGVAAVT